jgi:hypothetical protein
MPILSFAHLKPKKDQQKDEISAATHPVRNQPAPPQEIRHPFFIVALGSAQVKPSQKLLGQLSLCPAILIALDNDQAGAKAALWWAENVPGCHRTLTPSQFGKDFGEAFLSDLNLWISAAMTIVAETLTMNQG